MTIDPFHFVLGFLSEYNGRVVRSDDPAFVELVFGNEGNIELFQDSLEKVAKQKGIVNPIEIDKQVEGQDSRTTFRSSELPSLINGQYKVVKTAYEGQELFSSRDLLREASATQEFSFLSGAYARFGDGGIIRIANAEHKIGLVAELLSKHGCEEISVTFYPGYVPRVFELCFAASKEVSDVLVANLQCEELPRKATKLIHPQGCKKIVTYNPLKQTYDEVKERGW